MRTSAYLLLKIAFLLAIANTGDVIAAEITVDDGSQNSRAVAANVPGNGAVWNSLAQSFTATDPFVRFGFRLFDEDSSLPNAGTSLVYKLYQGENVYTALLATRTVTMPSTLSTDARSIWGDVGFVEADFSSVALTPGSRYTVEITLPAGNLPPAGSYSGIGVWTSLLNPYAGGRFFFTANYDNSFFVDQDMLFHVQPVNVQVPDDVISTIAGNGAYGFSGDLGPATSASLRAPRDIAVDASGNRYIADTDNYRIRRVAPGGTITTYAGALTGEGGDGGPAINARFGQILGVAVDGAGNVYVADISNNRVRKISPNGIITAFAGNGIAGYSGDGGLATQARLNVPTRVAADSAGNIYIADEFNNRIRKVNPAGVIQTIAGDGSSGFNGDNRLATSASIWAPFDVAIDSAGNLYVSDLGNRRIRKISAAGMISTIAGNGGMGSSGDNGPATSANVHPLGLDVDGAGNVYVADPTAQRIRVVTPAGLIKAVAGNGVGAYAGDGGPALSASLWIPNGVAIGPSGKLYIADEGNNRIRKVGEDSPAQSVSTLLVNVTTQLQVRQLSSALSAPLRNIAKVLADSNPNNDDAACGKLDDFISTVEAKVAAGKLAEPDGIDYVLQAEGIKDGLGCP